MGQGSEYDDEAQTGRRALIRLMKGAIRKIDKGFYYKRRIRIKPDAGTLSGAPRLRREVEARRQGRAGRKWKPIPQEAEENGG